MSAGAFTRTRYEVDGGGTIVNLRVQPETLLADFNGTTNDAPAGAVSLSISAYARKSNRQYGVGCRTVTIAWTAAPPTGYKDALLTIPVLQESVWDGIADNSAVTYLSAAAVVVSKSREMLT